MIKFDKECKNKETWQCHCGCEEEIAKYNRNGLLYYARGHHRKGKIFPNEKRNQIGENNNNFRGGKIIDGSGYIKIRYANHPRASPKGKYIREHILIMEKYLGRYLNENEIIHHINRNKQDNRIENLELTTREEHSSYHRKQEIQNRKTLFRKDKINQKV